MRLKDRLDELGYVPKPPFKRRPEILLNGQIPEPLYGLAPRVVLGAKWWDETRKVAYASTGYHCIACGVYKTDSKGPRWLEGHEVYVIDFYAGTMTYVETVPLCHYCHSYIHCGRLKWLLDEGKITHSTYAAIIQHGDRVLAQAGLRKPGEIVLDGACAPWDDWCLVVNGKKYKPPRRKTRKRKR
jgi:hypothetical protein